MTDRTFDRLPQFDERSRSFPIRTLIPQTPVNKLWVCRAYLDQGSEGACVGFSWAHELAARPVEHVAHADVNAHAIYNRARELDEWPGEDYEGTSVLAGAKAVQEKKFMDEYRWAFGLDDLILAVGHVGPVVLGINWYEDMMEPTPGGLVRARGSVVGGHAILCRGVNVTMREFRLRNSWGKSWGYLGDCYVTFDDMGKLLADQGEACIPVVRK